MSRYAEQHAEEATLTADDWAEYAAWCDRLESELVAEAAADRTACASAQDPTPPEAWDEIPF